MFDHEGHGGVPALVHRTRIRLGLLVVALALAVVPAAARADGLYVVNDTDNTVGQYAISGGLLSPLVPPTVAIGDFSYSGIAARPDGRFVYVDYGTSIAAFSVDPVSGALTAGPVYTGSAGLSNLALTPDGRSLYAGASDNNVYQFDVDPATGTLTPKTPASVVSAGSPYGIAVTPDGHSAYVVDEAENLISEYDVNPTTGVLTAKSTATVATGNEPLNIAISPNGRSAYVTDPGNFGAGTGMVGQYDIDPTTGLLTPKTPASVASGDGPVGLAVSPGGTSLYVGDQSSDAVSEYDIDPTTGALTAKTPATVPAGTGARGVAVSSDGTGVYVANFDSNNISQYSVAPGTGVLSPETPPTVAAGQLPNNLVTVALAATPPVVTGISPTSGSQLGGTTVTISGSGFTSASTVSFGSTPATGVTVNSSSSITAISPAGTGTVDVTVTTSVGTSHTSSADAFTYTAVPVSDSLGGSYILDEQLWQRINLPAGSTFTGSADLAAGSFTGAISVPNFTATLYVLGVPNALHLSLTPTGPVSGTASVTGGLLALSATANLSLTVTLPSGPGWGWGPPASTCTTSSPLHFALSSSGGPAIALETGLTFTGKVGIAPLVPSSWWAGPACAALSLLLVNGDDPYSLVFSPS